MDLTDLIAAADFTTVITGMVAVAGATALLYVAWKGIGMILQSLKR